MSIPRLFQLTLFCAVAASAVAPAWSQQRGGRPPGSMRGGAGDGDRGRFDGGDAGSRSEAAEAVRRAQAQSGGRVLGAERVQFDGRDIMRVKVMDDQGRVRYMDDDLGSRAGQRRGSARNDAPAGRPRGANPPRP